MCFWQWDEVSSTFILYCPIPHPWCSQPPPWLWFLSGSQGVLVSPIMTSIGLGFIRWVVILHVVLAPQFVVWCNSFILESLSGPSQLQCPHGSYLEFHSVFSFFSPSIEIIYVCVCSSGHSWQLGYGSVSSPLSLLVADREGTLVFSISAHLAIISSLPAFVVWHEVIHEAGAGRVEGNPVRAHSFRSVSPSAAFHRAWSISSVLEAVTWGTTFFFSSFIYVFSPRFAVFCSFGPFVAPGERIS